MLLFSASYGRRRVDSGQWNDFRRREWSSSKHLIRWWLQLEWPTIGGQSPPWVCGQFGVVAHRGWSKCDRHFGGWPDFNYFKDSGSIYKLSDFRIFRHHPNSIFFGNF